VVGNHDPFCDDLELLLAVYGRDWDAMVGKRPPLWHQQPQFAGFFGIGQDERPYHTRFAAVAVDGGSAPSSDPPTSSGWSLTTLTDGFGFPTACSQLTTASRP
jgi:hypothetical protein